MFGKSIIKTAGRVQDKTASKAGRTLGSSSASSRQKSAAGKALAEQKKQKNKW